MHLRPAIYETIWENKTFKGNNRESHMDAGINASLIKASLGGVTNFVEESETNRIVFNIKGNAYRLIVKFNFEKQWAFIRFIGIHAQYDKINADKI